MLCVFGCRPIFPTSPYFLLWLWCASTIFVFFPLFFFFLSCFFLYDVDSVRVYVCGNGQKTKKKKNNNVEGIRKGTLFFFSIEKPFYTPIDRSIPRLPAVDCGLFLTIPIIPTPRKKKHSYSFFVKKEKKKNDPHYSSWTFLS